MKAWHIVAFLMIVGLAVLIGRASRSTGGAPGASTAGHNTAGAAATGALTDLQGQSVSLESFRGKVVLLDFWATWCPPCRAALPHTQAFSESPDAKNGKLVVLAVNVREDKGKVAQFVQENHYTMRVLLDSDGALSDQFKVDGIPNFVVLGRDGKIAYQEAGLNESGLKAALETALKE